MPEINPANVVRDRTVFVQWKKTKKTKDFDIQRKFLNVNDQFLLFFYSKNKRSSKGHLTGYDMIEKAFQALQGLSIRQTFLAHDESSIKGRDENLGLWIFQSAYTLTDRHIDTTL